MRNNDEIDFAELCELKDKVSERIRQWRLALELRRQKIALERFLVDEHERLMRIELLRERGVAVVSRNPNGSYGTKPKSCFARR